MAYRTQEPHGRAHDRSLRPVTSTRLWLRGGASAPHCSGSLETRAPGKSECRERCAERALGFSESKSPSAQAAGGDLHGQARAHSFQVYSSVLVVRPLDSFLFPATMRLDVCMLTVRMAQTCWHRAESSLKQRSQNSFDKKRCGAS